MIRSWIAFVIPMTLIGRHALSVDTTASAVTCALTLTARTTFAAPPIFVATAWLGKYSHVGTCFIAAAWKTKSQRRTARSTEA